MKYTMNVAGEGFVQICSTSCLRNYIGEEEKDRERKMRRDAGCRACGDSCCGFLLFEGNDPLPWNYCLVCYEAKLRMRKTELAAGGEKPTDADGANGSGNGSFSL